MTLTSSITNALVGLIVIVVVIGVILGLSLAGIDIFNPRTSAALERQMDERTDYLAQVNALEIKKQAELDTIEINYNERKAELGLRLLPFREYVLTIALGLALVALAAGIAVLMAGLAVRLASDAQSGMAPAVPSAQDRPDTGDGTSVQRPIPLFGDYSDAA
jgi:hypothetical protein